MARQGVTAPPEVVAIALAARQLGASQPQAAALAGVSHTSVDHYEDPTPPAAVEAVTPALLQAAKLTILGKWIELTKAGQEQSLSRMGDLNAYQAALVGAIGTDKILALSAPGAVPGTGESNALDELIERPGGREVIGELLVNMSRALSDLAARPARQVETIDVEAVSLPSQGAVGERESKGGGGMEGEGRGRENQPDDGNHTQQH